MFLFFRAEILPKWKKIVAGQKEEINSDKMSKFLVVLTFWDARNMQHHLSRRICIFSNAAARVRLQARCIAGLLQICNTKACPINVH